MRRRLIASMLVPCEVQFSLIVTIALAESNGAMAASKDDPLTLRVLMKIKPKTGSWIMHQK